MNGKFAPEFVTRNPSLVLTDTIVNYLKGSLPTNRHCLQSPFYQELLHLPTYRDISKTLEASRRLRNIPPQTSEAKLFHVRYQLIEIVAHVFCLQVAMMCHEWNLFMIVYGLPVIPSNVLIHVICY